MKITDAAILNGNIRYRTKVAPTPATSETTGIVTINNAAIPGVPAHFETTFHIQAELESGGIKASNSFFWNSIVMNEDDETSYHAIEDEGAKQIPPMLRELADRIEEKILAYDARRAAKNEASSE